MRVALHERRVEADQLEQLGDPRGAGLARGKAVDAQRLGQDLADGLARVEARVRVLEDHLELAPPLPQVLALERQEVLAVERDRARQRLRDAHDRPADRGLARARLADEPERLAARDGERDAVDRVDPAGPAAQDAGQ